MATDPSDAGLDLVLDNRKLILVFAFLMLLCGGFFVFGFIEGKRQVVSAAPEPESASPAPTVQPPPSAATPVPVPEAAPVAPSPSRPQRRRPPPHWPSRPRSAPSGSSSTGIAA